MAALMRAWPSLVCRSAAVLGLKLGVLPAAKRWVFGHRLGHELMGLVRDERLEAVAGLLQEWRLPVRA